MHALDSAGLPTTLLVVPAATQGPAPLLVFFHGAGGAAASSLPLVEEAAAARGALALLPSSSDATWDMLVGDLGRDVAALDAALDAVLSRFPVTRVAFGGFSDGASYALSLGLANGDLADTLLAFSPGFVAPPGQVGRPRVWLSHGRADAVLPIGRCGRRVARQLEGAGHQVHYEEFAGGHVVPPALVEQAVGWWLGAPPTSH